VAEVPTIRITFLNQFPSLAGRTGTLTFADINGNVVGSQPLVYQPGTTVDVLYPGTRVNADGSIADVPGWNLVGGFWVRDPSDAFLREGINLTYTVNPTATAFVTYPPESANCANPDGPFPPGTPSTPAPGTPGNSTIPGTPTHLPTTGADTAMTLALAALASAGGTGLVLIARRRRRPVDA
jgi:LPXTG-motif cell wall-anchored protein